MPSQTLVAISQECKSADTKGEKTMIGNKARRSKCFCYSNLNVHLSLKIEGSLQFLLLLNNVLMCHCLILSVSLTTTHFYYKASYASRAFDRCFQIRFSFSSYIIQT